LSYKRPELGRASLRFGSSDIQSKYLGEIYKFRGSWEGGLGGGVYNLFESFSVSVSLHSFYILALSVSRHSLVAGGYID